MGVQSPESESAPAPVPEQATQSNNRREYRQHDRREHYQYRNQQVPVSTKPDPDAFVKGIMSTMSQDCKDVLGLLLVTRSLDIEAADLNATLGFVRSLRTPPQKSMEQIIGGAIEKYVETSAQYKGLGVAMKLIGAGV